MCAPDSTDRPDRVGVLLQCGLRHQLGRLEQAGVHDLEARVAQGPCDHLGAAIVSVQPGLGDDDAVASQHRLRIAGVIRPDGAVTLPMGSAHRPKDTAVAVDP